MFGHHSCKTFVEHRALQIACKTNVASANKKLKALHIISWIAKQ
jgi:hypothetical protein